MRPASTPRLLVPALGLLGAVCALTGAACGDAPGRPEPDTADTADARTRPDSGEESRGRPEARGAGSARNPTDASRTARARPPGPAACAFEPPPGRLAVDRIPAEVDGTSCEQALRLIETAAVGQPAGANLELARDGFECTPSTVEKGADVTYDCVRGSQEVSFEVTWSGEGP